MPWREVTTMSSRKEFVVLASQEGANIRELCRRFAITPRTGYKWLERYRKGGDGDLGDRSRRPQRSPTRTGGAIEDAVLTERRAHPAWGARKLHARLVGQIADLPSPSTVGAILQRAGAIDPKESTKHRAFQRFEHAHPNQLWQTDFKGHVPLARGRCHPLTVLDDHSRYALGLAACADETGATVQTQFTTIFRRYGLPERILFDNGAPWGGSGDDRNTALTVWLLRLGIALSHGRPYHPQTQGKDERFHRTLMDELLGDRCYLDLLGCQAAFDTWRAEYNHDRPHQALDYAVPSSRYTVSPRSLPTTLPPITYDPALQVRRVQGKGEISFQNREFLVGRAFHGHPVGLCPSSTDGRWEVYFCQHLVTTIDFRASA
jgi:transposase InsO family protein